MSNIKKDIERLIRDNRSIELKNYLKFKLRKGFFKQKNLTEIIGILPFIMENTNVDNCDWMFLEDILINGKDIFIRNISKIKYGNNLALFYEVLECLNILGDNLSDRDIMLILDGFVNVDVVLTDFEIKKLMYLCNDNIDLKAILEKYIRSNNTCVGTSFYIFHSKKKYIDLVYDNIDFIINTPNIDLFSFRRLFVDRVDILEKINKKIDDESYKNVTNLVKSVFSKFSLDVDLVNNKEFDTIIDVVYMILEDISKNEMVPLSNIDIIDSGYYSVVFGLADKVIKIGADREVKSFPNNPYINAILLRREFKINDNLGLFIEVNEKVDTNSKVSKEELYQLYKKLRDIGLVWTDVSFGNVGRLLKDNNIYWRQELPITDDVIGLDEYREGKKLKKGDIVVLDNDSIYDINDSNLVLVDYGLNKEFYDRYELEKSNKSSHYR